MQKAFIIGNPRSGTTLLRLMLNAHPEIVAPPECGFLHWWYQKYKNWNDKDALSVSTISSFIDDLLGSKKIETWNLPRDGIIQYILNKQPDTYADLGALVYKYWAEKKHKSPSILMDKNNYYIRHLEDLIQIWPNAKFIFLVRDGRDVACSYKAIKKLDTNSPYKPNLPESIDDIANEWSHNNKNVISFLESKQNNDYHIIRYEDLLRNPIEALSSLLSIFHIPFSEEMLDFYKYNDEPNLTIDWKKKTLEKVDGDNVGKFKKILTNQEIIDFQNIASQVLLRFNYELI
ncbi:MAG: sulfotransferase [Bacteroidetes bacterium]|nr:sulfotransferase [Bacteroidota bacterium]